MKILVQSTTPRIQYMANWLGQRLFGSPLTVVTNIEALQGDACLNYSTIIPAVTCYTIHPAGFLSQSGFNEIHPEVFGCDQWPAFFKTPGGDHPFDVLSASFYLISRYEEYVRSFTKDEYGRYSHTNSMAYRHGFLKRPLIDEWLMHLKKNLLRVFPDLRFACHKAVFRPTYDVDIAWNHLHKGLLRNAGAAAAELFSGRWNKLHDRLLAWTGRKKDPFDVFDALQDMHKQHTLKPIWFFLLAKNYKGYDRNVPRQKRAYHRLIRHLSSKDESGIHFSWAAASHLRRMAEERDFMESMVEKPVQHNRMHYLNFHLPHTYRMLLQSGIRHDHSMGYGTINGFRASTCMPFAWYDLENEMETELMVHPFGWMDANCIFEQKDSPDVALKELQAMWQQVSAAEGELTAIWHNHLMGYDAEGRRWWWVFEEFLKSAT